MLILGEGAGPMSEIGRSRSEYDRRSSLGHEIRRRLPSLKFAAGTKFAVFRRGNSASINHVKFAYVFCIHTSIAYLLFQIFRWTQKVFLCH